MDHPQHRRSNSTHPRTIKPKHNSTHHNTTRHPAPFIDIGNGQWELIGDTLSPGVLVQPCFANFACALNGATATVNHDGGTSIFNSTDAGNDFTNCGGMMGASQPTLANPSQSIADLTGITSVTIVCN